MIWSANALIIFLVFFGFLIAGGSAGAGDRPPRAVVPAGIAEKYSINPVFACNTYICEAGKQNRQVLVLVHGVGDDASIIWSDLIELLAERFHVIAFDLPGFGRSEKANTLYSPERYGQFIYWLIKEHTNSPVILLGHSMGGALVVHYASTYPETVKHLIVVDAAAILHRIAITKSFVRIEEPVSQQKGLAGLLNKSLAKPLHVLNHLAGSTVEKLEFSNTDPGIDSIVDYKGLRSLFLGGNSQTIAGLALVQENFTGLLDTKVPTSIIWGRNDDIAPLRTGKLLAGRLPNSRLRIIDQAGHVPMKEQKDEFNRVLLAEIDSPPAGIGHAITSGHGIKVGLCKQQNDMVFTGNFDRIMIDGCNRVLIKDASARYIEIKKSEVIMEDTTVRGTKTALELVRSQVIGTNLLFEGETAINSSGSRLDLAGAQINGRRAAVATPDKTVILFSLCKISSPFTKGNVHGIYRLDAEKCL